MVKYLELKNDHFIHQELHYKKLLYYFENMGLIYKIGPVLLVKKNAGLNVIFSKT